jgi:hypothetical protein
MKWRIAAISEGNNLSMLFVSNGLPTALLDVLNRKM